MPRPPHPDAVDFEDVFRVHAPGLLRLIRSTTDDSGSADDILQETFVRFFRFYVVPGRLDPARPVGPLLATIARRETARRGRTLGRHRHLDAVTWSAPAQDAVGSDDHVAALHDAPIVRAALADLHPRQRRLLLQWERRRSTESLARAEQVSVPVLKQVVVRARRNFRERYQAACDRSSGVASVVALPFVHVAVRLRSRLRTEPTRYDALVASLGLAACSVVVVAHVAGGPVESRAVEMASSPVVAVPPPPSPVATTATPVVAHRGVPPVDRPGPSPSTGRSAPAATTSHVAESRADISITSTRPGGETRSMNSLTVQCDAGMTGRALCTAIDLLPPDLSWSRDP